MLVLIAAVVLTPLASAGVTDVPLPAGWSKPTDVAFAPDGALVVTLEGNWALGRIDLQRNASTLVPLGSKPVNEQDTMWDVRFSADTDASCAATASSAAACGVTAWTASGAAAHRVKFGAPQQAASFALPSVSQLVGDLYLARDGSVWIAQVDAGKLLRLDPSTANVGVHDVPAGASGPLTFDEAPDGTVYLSATYANAYARFDPATGAVTVVGRSGLLSPVGLAHDANGTLWAAEMGASRVSALFPTTTSPRVGYPTSPSSYYAVSGPSGIVVAKDGAVWFAEHFADRIARLDPANGTLVEYELASAPGTNVQRVALARDGSVWAAEYSRDKLARAVYSGESLDAPLPANVTLEQGGGIDINVSALTGVVFGSDDENLTANPTGSFLTLHATAQLPVGDHRVLIATHEGKTTVGRYVVVSVRAAPHATTPSPAPALTLALVFAMALALRRRRG